MQSRRSGNPVVDETNHNTGKTPLGNILGYLNNPVKNLRVGRDLSGLSSPTPGRESIVQTLLDLSWPCGCDHFTGKPVPVPFS